MKINLVENGVFPITKDADGNLLEGALDTGLSSPGTAQGEGKLLGTACLFIRTSGCNLRCAWVGADGNGSPCDTPYSSHHAETNKMEIDDVVKLVQANRGKMNYVVVSGGEPTMQQGLSELLAKLQSLSLHTTIETNATIFNPLIARHTNLISMSPKLASSTPHEANLKNTGIDYSEHWAKKHEAKRRNIDTIQKYIDAAKLYDNDFQLKFVVQNPNDIQEIENDFLAHLLGWTADDVVLMPEGTSSDMLADRSYWAIEAAINRGWRFTPRLHIELFGKARAV
jgi:7-carboxy-7-deazaguanine synthase|tara:strand:- start:3032 stop:3880 length:849 start_codon:yes stop_codon:yes gene_type:complete